MITHYFTLHALSKELNSYLRGAEICEIFTQHKNELLISFDKLPISSKFSNGCTLYVSVEPELNYIFLWDRVSRSKKNSVDLFQDILKATVEQINIMQDERILILELDCGERLLIQLFNSAASNVFHVNEANIVKRAFKNNKTYQSKLFSITNQHFNRKILTDVELFAFSLISKSANEILTAIKKTIPIIGSFYGQEILYRANIDKYLTANTLDMSDVIRIQNEIQNMIQESLIPHAGIYSQERRKIFSVVPLRHLQNYEIKTCNNVNEAIQNYVARKFHESMIENRKNTLEGKIRMELAKTGDAMRKIERSQSNNSEYYEQIGQLLIANLNQLKKGMKKIELANYSGNMSVVQISLDPALTPVQNVERYFEKSKKMKIAHEESIQRLKQLSEKVNILKKFKESLNHIRRNNEMKEFINEHSAELKSMKLLNDKLKNEQPPFRIFTVASGFEVWVGKSSANNDLLTMKYAKPNDIWFHARGASGSHTVLKVKKGTKDVPREAIHQAASIAAYFSKMKNASNVPVAYCERKYVRKDKKAPAGTVFLEREEVIFVKPCLLGNP